MKKINYQIMTNNRECNFLPASLTEANIEYQEAERDYLASVDNYSKIDLSRDAQEAVGDMLAKKEALDSINADLSYIAGALDAVKLLKSLGLIHSIL